MKNIYIPKRRAIVFFGIIILLFSFSAFAQVGIGTTDPKTQLDINGALSLREGPPLTSITNGAIALFLLMAQTGKWLH